MKRRFDNHENQQTALLPTQRKQRYFLDTFQSRNAGLIWDQFVLPVQERHVEEVFSALVHFLSKPVPVSPFVIIYDINKQACLTIRDVKTLKLWRFVETLLMTILQTLEFDFCNEWLKHFPNETLVKSYPTTFPTEMAKFATVHFLKNEFADQCNLFIGPKLIMLYSLSLPKQDLRDHMNGVRQVWLSNPQYQPACSETDMYEYLKTILDEGGSRVFDSEWIIFLLGWYAKALPPFVLKFARMISFFTKFESIFDRLWNPIVVNVNTICWQDLKEANDRRNAQVLFWHRDLSFLLSDLVPVKPLHCIISEFIFPPLLRNQIVFQPTLPLLYRDRILRIFGS